MSGRPDWPRWTADPFGAAVTRPTALLGTLWATGGLLALLWATFGVPETGRPAAVALLGVFGTALGVTLLVFRGRVLAHGLYVALTLLGTVVICAIVWWSGPTATGAPAILFVYVGVFACVVLGSAARVVLPASAAAHAGTLAVRATPEWFGEWLVIWGATTVAGVLMGAAVAGNRRVTAEQERLFAELRSADETKTAFLYALGHDLGTPAATLVGLARTLIERDPHLDPEQRAQLLERIVANADRLHNDLTALLRLEELTTGRVEARLERVPLDAVVTGAIDRAGLPADQVERRGLGELAVEADVVKLQHAIANLLTNAAKYGGRGPIVVSAVDEDDRTIIRVDDRGPGIPEELRERIFEPLQRARAEDVDQGWGIGLAVVRAFARFHGGESWVEAAPEGGARFCIALPRVDVRRR